MDVSKMLGGKSLSAADLNGGEYTLVIANVAEKQFPNDPKPKLEIWFQNAKKSFIANATNISRIAKMYGPESDDWIGQEITLYTEEVDFKGDTVEAIRVRIAKPVQQPAKQTTIPARGTKRDMDDEIPF